MDTPIEDLSMLCGETEGAKQLPKPDPVSSSASVTSNDSSAKSVNQPILERVKQDRLEEFASAFLGMSVFDAADIWIPMTGESMDVLSHVTSITTSAGGDALSNFSLLSEGLAIQSWSGAVGRAFASGNPVWTSNKHIFVDKERVTAFAITNIQSVVAIPIMSPGTVTPVCVFSCYSLVKSDPVPFVLRFVQQALRLLWAGLDRVQPHVAVGETLWTNVAAADLGEMAADLEMQQEFTRRKRSHSLISPLLEENNGGDGLSVDLNSMGLENSVTVELVEEPSPLSIVPVDNIPMSVPMTAPAPQQQMKVPVSSIEQHMQGALKSVADVDAWRQVATTNDRRKRAHVLSSKPDTLRMSPAIPTPDQSEHNRLGFNLDEYDPIPVSGKSTPTQAPVSAVAGPSPQVTSVVYGNGTVSAPSQPQPQTVVYSSTAAPSQQPQTVAYGNASAPSVYGAAPSAPSPQPMMFNSTPSASPSPTPVMYKTQAPSPTVHSPQPNGSVLFNPIRASPVGSPRPVQPAPMPVAPTLATINQSGEAVKPLRQPNTMPSLGTPSPTASPITAPVVASPVGFVAAPNAEPMAAQQLPPQTLYQAQLPNGQIVYYQAQPGGPVFQGSSSGPVMLPTATVKAAPANVCLPTGVPQATREQQSSRPQKICRIEGCDNTAVSRRPYCERHTGNRLCEYPSCTKCAQGATRFCIAHGGGRRCTYPGCDKGARDKFFCAAHGGGKRCQNPGCTKSAVGGSNLCTSHGGGRRCSVAGCDKSAQSSTKFCVKHGGGKKCAYQGCERVARGRTSYCAGHGGGVRCKLDGCNRVAIGKLQLCRTHGGGSKSKARNVPPAVPLHSPSPPMPMQPNGLTQSI